MPELPDIQVYLEALAARVAGRRLERVRLASPFVLRSVLKEDWPRSLEEMEEHKERRRSPRSG